MGVHGAGLAGHHRRNVQPAKPFVGMPFESQAYTSVAPTSAGDRRPVFTLSGRLRIHLLNDKGDPLADLVSALRGWGYGGANPPCQPLNTPVPSARKHCFCAPSSVDNFVHNSL